MKISPRCWCGNVELITFSPDYLECTACETLISSIKSNSNLGKVINDEQDFYGRNYWFAHQENDLGFENIIARSRTDLSERCLHWLRAVLKYKFPPARILEVGSGHGGFVALLRQSGFDATGLEISPWVVDFARKTFDVPMLLGPVEVQEIDPGSLDVIALMDVLEHLPDPLDTMRRCLKLLKPDGLLVIQTPRFPENKSYNEMISEKNRFLEMLRKDEHLYLFGEQSIRQLFHNLGSDCLLFEQAFFPHYDMFVIVSQIPPTLHSKDEIDSGLSSTRGGRIIQSLLDKDESSRQVTQRLQESMADGEARLGQINELTRLFKEAESDRISRLEQINELTRRLKDSETDREVRLGQISELTRRLKDSETDGEARLGQINELTRRLKDSETDREARLEIINRLSSELRLIQHNIFYRFFRKLYRLYRKLGLFSKLGSSTGQPSPLENHNKGSEKDNSKLMGNHIDPAAGIPRKKLSRVAVDLTPVLPGGENGGAKLMTIELIRNLSRVSTDCEFILLTSTRNNAELADLDAPNVRRIVASGEKSKYTRIQSYLYPWMAILPVPLKEKLKYLYSRVIRKTQNGGILRDLDVGLLFCPFTAPFFYDPAVPVVSVIYDLQFRQYPQFFTSEDRFHRNRTFKEACRLAKRFVCISNYVHKTVIETEGVPSDRVCTIYIRMPCRIAPVSSQTIDQILERHGLKSGRFLLFPANFWEHKNHQMLLTALGMYRARHPDSDLKLVCTGIPDPRMEYLRDAARYMGLAEEVKFPGYLSEDEFSALMHSCKAVIYPSLYEGFGMPILEAMASGKPVLCSDATSLPEIAGEAALFFDPKRPKMIMNSIERLEHESNLVSQLIELGRNRAAKFGDAEQMAREYWWVFEEAAESNHFADIIHGVYSDGWCGERVYMTYKASDRPRRLELEMNLPSWLPTGAMTFTLTQNGSDRPAIYRIKRAQTLTIQRDLSQQGGFIELVIDNPFQPKAFGMGDDTRFIGPMCQACRIVSEDGIVDLFEPRVDTV
jgi:glycosyltransferase involved in cell wall biosynthesis/2-polyprenyl-3-methyl-5-hydroxy-6-metoxy-1,4-benzoquinol methylase